MRWIIIAVVFILSSACGVTPQPQSIQTVAAFEVPLRSQAEREDFLLALSYIAQDHAMHVDAETPEELERRAKVSPTFKMTISAAVWSGAGDDEAIASVMDEPSHLGRPWISFYKGANPALNIRFREATMSEIMRKWPGTLSLPIMPTGAIPLSRDLVKTPKGYVVSPTEAHKYKVHGADEEPR
jgi:hypothetical protein